MKKADLKWSELPFDYIKTDCHIEYNFRNGKWDGGIVVKDDMVSLSISSTCLHYGQECFEGTKAFETKDGRVIAFRTEENAKRMTVTAKKILMQPFPEDEFVRACDEVVRLNARFIPPYGSGASMYIRPLLIGVTGTIGIKPSREYKWIVFATPVGPYFKNGLKPIKLLVEEVVDRAAPNGVGDVKVGGNYAAGLRASFGAKAQGYDEVLYLDALEKRYIDESGATNFYGITKDGKYVTPSSHSILPSITNMSLRQIARDLGITVEDRPIPVEELREFTETGCCGTAAIITPVHSITYRGETITYNDGEHVGPVTTKIYKRLEGIQSGDVDDTHGWTHEIKLD